MPLDPIELLVRLIEARSYSAQEGQAADALCETLHAAGAAGESSSFTLQRIGDNVVCSKGGGPTGLLLNSHLDTVPASPGWTRDPWKADIEGDRLYGLGATDAKSCVAAMAAAFIAAADPGPRGRLIFAATTEEETGGSGKPNGLETVLPTLGALGGGIVGEPTRLNICNGQRGMVRLVLHAEGRSGHASRPWEGVNAIERAAEDVLALRALAAEIHESGFDPLVGRPTIQATIIRGGTAPNVIPDHCEIVLDARTTPRLGNDEMIARIERTVGSRLEVRSKRFHPVATAADARLVRVAQEALPHAAIEPFGGVSDMFFLAQLPAGPVPAVLIGPGDGRQSHQPDEFVSIAMVRRAAVAYRRIADRFWESNVCT